MSALNLSALEKHTTHHARVESCTHQLSGLPCVNTTPHTGGGRGCVHLSTSGVPDRHDRGVLAGH